jgi:hypothetical protein
MNAKAKSKRVPVALGFKAGRGGSVVVGVAADGLVPRVVLSTFLATGAEGDRLSLEPYHVAYEMARGARDIPAEAARAVKEGRKRQDKLAAKGLEEVVLQLQDAGCTPVAAALLINRAGWMTDLLQHALSAPEHPPVIEGLAVRDALRHALRHCSIAAVEMDEKTLQVAASGALRLSIAAIDTHLKNAGATAGKPWRKEQKLACLAAWIAITGR